MIKNNKWKLIVSSIIIMLPSLIGIFGNSFLPDKIATHWGFDGKADGFMNPLAAFTVIPAVLLAVHWICIILTAILDKNFEQSKKVASLIFFVIPVMSLFVCGMILAIALGNTPNTIFAAVIVLLCVMFIVIGNYMPKTTRNRTMGIRIKWTLSSDENWQATHRFAGKVFVLTGVLCLFTILLPLTVFPFVCFAIIATSCVITTVYSYSFYKKQLAEGTLTKETCDNEYNKMLKSSKSVTIITVISIATILVFVPILMFTGDIEAQVGEYSLTLEADFFDDLTLDYDDIDSVEYRESGVDGTRAYGFGSARLLLGIFSNDEFGNYTRYTYTGNKPAIVIKSGEKIIVLGLKDTNETKALYENLFEKVNS